MTGQLRHPAWRTSSYSTSQANCVEVATLGGPVIGVRDSKDPHGPVLTIPARRWSAFLRGVAAGELPR
ncbi:MAG: DUF397 domain-containing protein [Pseudonocardiales bacterium]|nr:DUF397 domain-containing protein [Pseudonocardiales bacterium]